MVILKQLDRHKESFKRYRVVHLIEEHFFVDLTLNVSPQYERSITLIPMSTRARPRPDGPPCCNVQAVL